MKILLALASFKDYLNSIDANLHLKKKFTQLGVEEKLIKIFPMADGGEYTGEVLNFYLKKKKFKIATLDIFNKKIFTNVYLINKQKVFVSSSEILGLRNYQRKKLNPLNFSSYGLGMVVKKLSKNYKEIIIGLGGTQTLDVGAGALQALGAIFLDKNNNKIKNVIPKNFLKIDKVTYKKNSLKSNLTFICDGKSTIKDFNFDSKIGENISKKKIKNIIYTGINHYYKKLSNNQNINKVLYGANGGGIIISFINHFKINYVDGADFIYKVSGIKKYNKKNNILVVGEGIFDNSLNGKSSVFLSNKLNKINNNYYLCSRVTLKDIFFKKNNIFLNSKYLKLNFNINNIYILKKIIPNQKNIKKQLSHFSLDFLKYIKI